MSQEHRARLRAMTRGAYDFQKLRIATGLRLCANFRARLGQSAGTKEEDLEEGAKEVLKELRERFARLTDGIARNRTLPKKEGFKGDEVITDYTELLMVAEYLDLERVERAHFNHLEAVLEDFPIHTQFLTGVRGLGPAISAVIISEIDIHAAKYPSSIWMYAGLDVAPDGRGRSRRKEHLVKRKYINSKGEEAERDSVTFSPFLKTKLMGVLATNFLRSGSPYRGYYDQYKHRISTDPARADWAKLRIHNASLRYMVKMFLKDLYNAWRRLEGLPVAPTYHEAKQGHSHGRDAA